MDKANDIVSELFNNPINPEAQFYISLNKKWTDILADKRLSEHCRLEEMEGDKLKISFDHPGWIQLFKMNQHTILKRINALDPMINISLLSLYVKDKKRQTQPSPVRETQGEDKTEMESVFSEIKDDDLKSKLAKLRKKIEENN